MQWKQRDPVHPYSDTDSLITKLAKIRGIDDIETWLYPTEKSWISPYELDNIDEACQRIVKAIHFQEKITIMADVDADGIFACAILYNYLYQCNVSEENLTYIHAQRSSGHGLETVMEDTESEDNGIVVPVPSDTDLLIIVDSSSNSVKECKVIKEKYGLDILIVDHHEMDKKNDYALIVNCQQGDYPNKSLSGSAMALKVVSVLDEYLDYDFSEKYFDLACIGLISDMMRLDIEENRYIVHRGLKNINNIGLFTLFKKSNVNMYKGISVTDIGYKITPIVNACTRYDKIELALELFTVDDEERIKDLAKQMIKLNEQRKEEETEIVNKAMGKIKNHNNIIILIDDEIGSGFRGLVATKIANKLNKCTFVLKYNEDTQSYHGSARSVGNIDLKNLVEITGDFIYAQGHSKAFGVGIEKSKFDLAIETLNELLDDNVEEEEMLLYDLALDVEEVDEYLIKEAEKFNRITGMNCPKAIFLVQDIIVYERELLGKKKKETVKIVADNDLFLMKFKVDEGYAQDIEDAIDEHLFDEHYYVTVDVVGELNLNEWYNFGKKEVIRNNQIFIMDYELYTESESV
jgi:single-stranded-DNA-specific exonuclease